MEKKINVVTGATGRLGFCLVNELKARGEYVRALIHTDDDVADKLRALADEAVTGDVRDPASLLEAFKGADKVYHMAGIVTIETKITKELRDVNIGGVKNVIDACLQNKVRRLIHCASLHAVHFSNNTDMLRELPYYEPDKLKGAYAISKAHGANMVLDAVRQQGLDAVIGMPAGILGPFEYRVSNLGQLVIDISEGKLPVYIPGRYNYVDVRDVANGFIDLSEKGVKGESYLLTGHIMETKEMVEIMAKYAGTKPPRVCLPMWLVGLFAPIAEYVYIKRGKRPLFTPYSLKVLRDNCNFSYEKAAAAIGYNPRSLEESIADEVAFFKKERGKA